MKRAFSLVRLGLSTAVAVAGYLVILVNVLSDPSPRELVYMSVKYDPIKGGYLVSDHLGVYRGAVYALHDVARIRAGLMPEPVTARELHLKNELQYTFLFRRLLRGPAHEVLSPNWKLLGFNCFHFTESYGRASGLVIPAWLLMVGGGVMAGRILARWIRKRRRRRAGKCVHCGYDIRGAKPPCPECGKI